MFCPICKAEYRPGFTICNDCNIQLVPELPPESPKDSHKMINYCFKGGLIGLFSYVLLFAIIFTGMYAFRSLGEGNIFAYLLVLLALPGGAILSPFWSGPAFEHGGAILSLIITSLMFFIIGAILGFIVRKTSVP